MLASTGTTLITLKLRRSHAPDYCWRITWITIAASVKEIKNNAFSNVTGLEFVEFEQGSILTNIGHSVS